MYKATFDAINTEEILDFAELRGVTITAIDSSETNFPSSVTATCERREPLELFLIDMFEAEAEDETIEYIES